ncbi:MAG: hypothetical protein JW891_00750 [Candidatus Lokiarchaeota archaeon]|nr:hypothetical protein [Candidatus Lokiarchaeota archaeon]
MYFFFTFLSISESWLGVVTFFLSIMIFNVIPPLSVYFLVQGGFLLWGPFTWILGVTKLTINKKTNRLIIQTLCGAFLLSFNVAYVIIALFAPELLAPYLYRILAPAFTNLHKVYLFTGLLSIEIFGIWFVMNTIKIPQKKSKLKGKILLLSLISLGIGVILIAIGNYYIIYVIIGNYFALSSVICFYWAFLFPKWLEKRLIKEN